MRFKVLILFLVSAAAALANITMTVYPSLAPNVYGSPSWNGYVANAMNALENGIGSIGDASTDPAAYYRVGSITPQDNIVTGFPSWLGQANPTGAFAGELGNRLHFGLTVEGNGTRFRLSQLSFVISSSDPGNMLGYTGDFTDPSDEYSSKRVGYVASTNTFITSGSATQLVDALFYVGVGNALAAYDSDPGATQQDKINNVLAAAPQMPYSITATYTLNGLRDSTPASASATVDVVPEPTSILLLATVGLGTITAIRRRKKPAA